MQFSHSEDGMTNIKHYRTYTLHIQAIQSLQAGPLVIFSGHLFILLIVRISVTSHLASGINLGVKEQGTVPGWSPLSPSGGKSLVLYHIRLSLRFCKRILSFILLVRTTLFKDA